MALTISPLWFLLAAVVLLVWVHGYMCGRRERETGRLSKKQ